VIIIFNINYRIRCKEKQIIPNGFKKKKAVPLEETAQINFN